MKIYNKDISILGDLTLSLSNLAGNILTIDSFGIARFRTPLNILSDIGADIAVNHVTSNGSDHTFINQDVTSNSSPSFNKPTSLSAAVQASELVRLDQLTSALANLYWQDPVEDQIDFTINEPSSPIDEGRYISTGTGLGSIDMGTTFTKNNIYEWVEGVWVEFITLEGWSVFDKFTDTNITFNGTNWVEIGSTVSHNNLTGLQGGIVAEYYHLTNSQLINNAYTNVNNNFSTNQNIAGDLSITGIYSGDGSGLVNLNAVTLDTFQEINALKTFKTLGASYIFESDESKITIGGNSAITTLQPEARDNGNIVIYNSTDSVKIVDIDGNFDDLSTGTVGGYVGVYRGGNGAFVGALQSNTGGKINSISLHYYSEDNFGPPTNPTSSPSEMIKMISILNGDSSQTGGLQILGADGRIVIGGDIINTEPTKRLYVNGESKLRGLIVEDNTTVIPAPFFSEDFAVSQGIFTTSGDALWTRVTDDGSGDLFSMRSGAITHNESTTLTLTQTTTQESTLLKYDYKTSTEGNFDFLIVEVDGIIVRKYSGTNAFTSDQVFLNGKTEPPGKT